MGQIAYLPNREHIARLEVAAAVRAHLAHAGISAARAAREIGMSQSAMSRRTTAQEPFDVDQLEAVASLLGVTIVELISGTLPPLNARTAPTPKGGGRSLPEMDSNHQPAGIKPGRAHLMLVEPLEDEEQTLATGTDGPLAPVLPIRR